MSVLAIELNDCGIVAARDTGIVLESPGFAVLGEGEPLVGEAAARRAFLAPSQANNRFWDELAVTPLSRSSGKAATHADLVYTHLSKIWDELKEPNENVILVVPAFYDRGQLELLLGIARAMDMPVAGLVDVAIVAAGRATAGETAAYLDLHLHRAALSRLKLDAEISHAGMKTSREVGMASLATTWVKAISRRFVQETRFDPLHAATTEQALHDQLPGLIANLAVRSAADVSIIHGARSFTVTLFRDELAADAERLYDNLNALIAPCVRGSSPSKLFISSRLAGLPGLLDQFTALGADDIEVLQPGGAALGAIEQRGAILRAPGSLSLVTRLPRRFPNPSPGDAGLPMSPAASPGPTHLVHEGIAYPLNREHFMVGRDLAVGETGLEIMSESAGISRQHFLLVVEKDGVVLEDQSTYGTFVNGERVEGRRALFVGDRIRVGTPGEELQIIALKAS